MTNPVNTLTVPSVSITTARTGASAKANELGMMSPTTARPSSVDAPAP